MNAPTPFELKLLRGNPGKRAMRPPPKPDCGAECPEPPAFLHAYAVEEWHRVAPELHRLKLLTLVDVGPLAAYCAAYGHWRVAEEALARNGELVAMDSRGRTRTNPWLGIARNAASQMVTFAGHFGLTPASRSRIAAGVGEQAVSKFDGLIS
jgi:P27 family predicted phage terminase small subunit